MTPSHRAGLLSLALRHLSSRAKIALPGARGLSPSTEQAFGLGHGGGTFLAAAVRGTRLGHGARPPPQSLGQVTWQRVRKLRGSPLSRQLREPGFWKAMMELTAGSMQAGDTNAVTRTRMSMSSLDSRTTWSTFTRYSPAIPMPGLFYGISVEKMHSGKPTVSGPETVFRCASGSPFLSTHATYGAGHVMLLPGTILGALIFSPQRRQSMTRRRAHSQYTTTSLANS